MGRVRGRGKKQTAAAVIEDAASGEEEKTPTQRRRGRPQKPAKDHVVPVDEAYGDEAAAEEDAPKVTKTKVAAVAGTVRKRKGSGKDGNVISNANGNSIFAIDGGQGEEEELENGIKQPKSETKDVARFVGFRTNGNRRKNKPRRAAEAGVECK
ncbi:hypothetical protein MLD38_020147 [Melastoma candidum]|uniref:Uncharacterized protein n=1 Tax=Melastoma candidum TaxID=119954 RepID=A0ACB9QD97_9MYRT|nr:hypothetical protein MLD38_020147 [Melastoma candidum]